MEKVDENKSLKALLLVGGFGTRLRPLTITKAKPLIEFVNKPIICHQIEALKQVGVSEIVLAINYQPEKMSNFIKDAEREYNVKITCSKENEPLGTAGPIGLAKDILLQSEGNEIFVFNSDVICTFPLREMLDFHRKHKKEGTIAVTQVTDPSKFGVIISDDNNKILNFIEKPQKFVGDNINSGLYIFNKTILERIHPVPCSIEREIFPQMAKEGQLFSFKLEGFWADIGQPKDYLIGTNLFLNNLVLKNSSLLGLNLNKDLKIKNTNIIGNVLIDSTASISDSCSLGPNVVIGRNVVIRSGARIKNSVLMDNTIVNDHAYVDGAILGWNSRIGKWSRIEGLTILGEEVVVSDEVFINASFILPNVTVKSSIINPGTVLMF